MGFKTAADWANAVDAGRVHVTTFRKTVASAATVANDFVDYTYFAGNPPANFYASAPLEAAYVEPVRGIHVPTMTGASRQFVKSITAMSAAAGATNTSNQNQRHCLCDYLLYYPFIDTDAVGEQQDMIQTVSLPRYTRQVSLGPAVLHGDFSDLTGWSSATTVGGTTLEYVGGVAHYTTTGVDFLSISKTAPLTVGRVYRYEFDILEGSSGILKLNSVGANEIQFSCSPRHVVIDAVALASTFSISRVVGHVANAYIDNVSVTEVLSHGAGGQIMCVSQSAASTVGSFTVSYTNQDGVSGRKSQLTYTKAVGGGGTLVSSTTNAVSGSQPFVQLQAGDTDVRSIDSVTMVTAGGGLMALVIVKPLLHFTTTQECRRTTTGNLESYGAATYFESVLMRRPVEILNGAVLGVLGLGNAGSLASSVLVGTLQTIWSN